MTYAGLEIDQFSENIRVQDDLYRHVNGKWLDSTEIPADKARWGSFNALAEQAENDVRVIIEDAQGAEPGTETRKIGDLFASFMDTERIAERGLSPLAEQLARVDEITDIAGFLGLMGTLDREGIAALIGLAVRIDPGNPERYIPSLVQAGLSLPDESYYRLDSFADTRTAYREHLVRLLTLAGITDPTGAADRAIALEHENAAQHWDNVASRDTLATYNLKSWDEIQQLVGIDLTPWRSTVSPEHPDAIAEAIVHQPSWLEGLGALLTEARLDDWKAWLRAKIVHSLAAFLTDDLVEENFSFYGTALTGVPTMRDRWKRGVSVTEGALAEAVGKEYVARHFPPAAKAAMDELVANLIEAYRQSITALEWMGEETRTRALEKLDAFTPKIGHPRTWRDYSALDIDPTDLLGNIRRSAILEHDRALAKVGSPVDRDEWLMSPQTVNAYYLRSTNEIVFPAAILQYPFFDAERDAAANYGGIGAVIGHEIGHGFDDQGSQYDGTGRLNDWWTANDREAFEERTKALIAQYDALVPEGLDAESHVNGSLTIGENIGDLGGLGIALKAYELSLDGQEAPVLDGYSGVQRVFLSWAQVWQQKSRTEEALRLLTVDPHSPAEFRCNQIVRNIDAFYLAFDVAEDDALYLDPKERVTIW